MHLSFLLMEQILSMALMIVIGYIAVKKGVIQIEDSKALSSLALYVIGPCIMLSAFQVEYTHDKLVGLLFAFLAAAVIHLVFIGLTSLGKRWFSLTNIEQASLIYTNCGNLILPLVNALLGKEMLFYACAYIVVQTILFWTHGVMLLSHTKRLQWKKIITNPNIIGVFIGLLLFFSNSTLPPVLYNTVDHIGEMIGPISMLIIGILMASVDLKQIFQNKKAYLICLTRLLLYPLAVMALFACTGIAGRYTQAAGIFFVSMLAAAAPAASSVTQGAEIFHADAKYASVLNMMSVIFCILTMPLMTAIYQLLYL